MLDHSPGQHIHFRNVVPEAPTGFTLPDLIGFARRRGHLVACIVVAALLVGVAYLVTATPLYTARAQILIDPRKGQPLAGQGNVASDAPVDPTAVDSQAELMRSSAVVGRVVDKLDLLQDPGFARGGQSPLGALTAALRRLVSRPAADGDARQDAIKQVRDNLTVQRLGRTLVLEVAYRSPDPDRAARLANAFGDAYTADQVEAALAATKRASGWLEARLAELREQSVAADGAVQAYRAGNNLVETGQGRTLTEQQLGDLNAQLATARTQTAEAKARLDRVRSFDLTRPSDSSVSDALSNTVITKLRDQYLENARKLVELKPRLGPRHEVVMRLQNGMEQLRRAVNDETRRIAAAYQSDYEIARSRQKSLEDSIAGLVKAANAGRQAGVQLRVLESAAQSYRLLYDTFLQRFAETVQQQSFPRSEARIITAATRGEKSSPKTAIVLGLALLAGALGGVGLGVARDRMEGAA